MSKRIIIVGPSCAGKNFIRDKFKEKGYQVDVSYTSREPREGEKNGIDYNFVSKTIFKNRIEHDDFYEWVEYNDNFYGTGVKEWLWCDIFIMETDGVKHIKPEDRKTCLIIYVNTPLETRAKRMVERDWSTEKIDERIATDIKKFKNFKDYDLEISSEVSDEHYFTDYVGEVMCKKCKEIVYKERDGNICPDCGEILVDIEDCTCYTCLSNKTCEWAFDPYNSNGDCLATK